MIKTKMYGKFAVTISARSDWP